MRKKAKAKSEKKLNTSIGSATKNKNSRRVINLPKIDKKQAKRIDKALKMPTVGFKRKISNDSLRHAYNEHKNDVVPLTLQDLKLIPQILFNPDKVSNSGKKHSVVYEKHIGKKLFVVEVKRSNKPVLELKTMYAK